MDKLTKEVKYLKGRMVSQGDLRAVIDLSDSAKKLADNELATKNLFQGESQGGSGGNDLIEVEGEVLTTLLVCDTGFLGGSRGNYILGEEVIEVDGLVED